MEREVEREAEMELERRRRCSGLVERGSERGGGVKIMSQRDLVNAALYGEGEEEERGGGERERGSERSRGNRENVEDENEVEERSQGRGSDVERGCGRVGGIGVFFFSL